MSSNLPSRPPPALGAREGIRQDLEAAKSAVTGYNPNGVGVSWTHDFLNKKPWHPMNFRNRVKVWEAEQQHEATRRSKDKARQEFKAEQEYLRTISLLSPEEQEKYRQRQAVSWLYQKPPGFKEIRNPREAKDGCNGDDKNKTNDGGNKDDAKKHAIPNIRNQEIQNQQRKTGGNYIQKVVLGFASCTVQRQEEHGRYELRRCIPGMSPPRGGVDPDAENQKFVVGEVDSDQEEEAYRLAMMSEEDKKRLRKDRERERRRQVKEERRKRETEKEERIKQAKEFLRLHTGIDVSSIVESSSTDESDDSAISSKGNRGKKRKNPEERRRQRQRRKS